MHAIIKHVELDYYFLMDLVVERRLDLRYTPSTDQIAYILIKPLLECYSLKIKLMVLSSI